MLNPNLDYVLLNINEKARIVEEYNLRGERAHKLTKGYYPES